MADLRGGQDPPTHQATRECVLLRNSKIQGIDFYSGDRKMAQGGVQFEIQGTEVHLKNTDFVVLQKHLSII